MRDRALTTAAEQRRQVFEEVWPVVEARLRRVLVARRVPAADHDDYLQEVAARALATEHLQFASAEDLVPWASTVLRRLHVDAHRRSDRVIVGPDAGTADDVVEATTVTDIAVEVEARIDLDTVVKVMATWSPDNREVLLSTVDDGARRPNSFYVRRHRLRLKLLAAMEGLGGLWGNVWRRMDPVAWVERMRAAEAAQPAAALLAPVAAAACAAALLFGGIVAGGNGSGDGERAGDEPRRDGDRVAALVAAVDDAGAVVTGDDGNAKDDRGGDDRRHPPRGPGNGRPPKNDGVVPPVEDRHVQGPEAAGYQPVVGVENGDPNDPPPFWCYGAMPVLGDGCVGKAVYIPI